MQGPCGRPLSTPDGAWSFIKPLLPQESGWTGPGWSPQGVVSLEPQESVRSPETAARVPAEGRLLQGARVPAAGRLLQGARVPAAGRLLQGGAQECTLRLPLPLCPKFSSKPVAEGLNRGTRWPAAQVALCPRPPSELGLMAG